MKFKIRENIYSGNTNNKINKKKYKHAMSPFCKMNAGNVEFNIDRFNHVSSGESPTSSGEGSPNGFTSGGMGESLKDSNVPTYTFSYKGPVYRFERVYTVLDEPIYTTAQNPKHASTILKGKLKKQFGFDYSARLDIDDDKIRLVDKPVDEYQLFLNKKDFNDEPDGEWIGNFKDEDIYFSDGRYISNGMEFSSMSELQDYLED